ncbi:MAG TPA: hypothetical protein VEP90_00030, partial [Methylomirabilota bacterium]|nr:hypothetical protein [Methylomirabilota bacterium]
MTTEGLTPASIWLTLSIQLTQKLINSQELPEEQKMTFLTESRNEFIGKETNHQEKDITSSTL